MDRQFAHLVVGKESPDLAAILLAQRQHQDGGALRAAQRLALGPGALTARQRRDDGGDVVGIVGLRYGHVRSLGGFAEPLANNGSGLVRISFRQFADRCTACAWTWPWTWATSISWAVPLVPAINAWPGPSSAVPSVK